MLFFGDHGSHRYTIDESFSNLLVFNFNHNSSNTDKLRNLIDISNEIIKTCIDTNFHYQSNYNKITTSYKF